MLLHCRFGHAGFGMLREMYRRMMVHGLFMEWALLLKDQSECLHCDSCARAGRRRSTYYPAPEDPRKVMSLQPLDKPPIAIQCDWLALVNCSSREGYLYVLKLIDVYSRRTWGHPAWMKSEAPILLFRWYTEESPSVARRHRRVEEQQPIHIADILQMTQDTPGQIEEAPPGRDSDQTSRPRLATRSDQSTGQSRQPVTAQYEPGSEPSDVLSIVPDASLAQASPDVSRATGSGWHHTIGTKCCPTVSSSGVYGAPSWTHVSLL